MNRMTWPSRVLDLLEDGLEALLELAAELRAGDQRAEVERDDALVLEPLGHVAAHDALGEALDDRGLADAGLADQHRVVLRAPAEDLDDAADLVVAADDRVELARARLRGEVAAVLLERLVRPLGVLARSRAGRRGRSAAPGGSPPRPAACCSSSAVPRRRPRPRRAAGARSRRTRRRAAVPRPRRARRRAWRGDRARASRPAIRARLARIAASSPRNAGRSTPSRRSVSAGMPSSGSTSALSRCSASRIGLCSRSAVCWAARTASWAFWVKRSSCMCGLSGFVRSARIGLVDGVEEAAGRVRGLVGQIGREDDLGADVQVAVAVGPELRHAAAAEPELPSGLRARRDPQQDAVPSASERAPRRRAGPPAG